MEFVNLMNMDKIFGKIISFIPSILDHSLNKLQNNKQTLSITPMVRKSRIKYRKRGNKSAQHLDEKRNAQDKKKKRKINLSLQKFHHFSSKNEVLAEQLGCKSVPCVMLTDEFNSSVKLLKTANLNKFDLEEVIEVLNRVHGSGLMKSIAVSNNMS